MQLKKKLTKTQHDTRLLYLYVIIGVFKYYQLIVLSFNKLKGYEIVLRVKHHQVKIISIKSVNFAAEHSVYCNNIIRITIECVQ